ncbi:MAG: GlsB/YeaQ/YmgE family stress response membrane protein [bacterium]|nr:GlsB/YeaQ/YmgE family stress response membrane protein [bacterium]
MSFIAWIGMGLLVGVLAKVIMPGKDPGGLVVTILIGIAGASVGGYLATLAGIGGPVTGFNLPSIVTATAGGVILLFVYRKLFR